jgi:hypothetical protein
MSSACGILTGAARSALKASTPLSHRTPGTMDDAEAGGALAVLAEVREQLGSELAKLAPRRKELKNQRKAQRYRGELKEVESKVEAMQRMLGLVEATEEQLAAQGLDDSTGGTSDISRIQAGEEVRLTDTPKMSPSRPLTYARVATSASLKLPSSGLAHLPPTSCRMLPPFLWACGRTTCCRC